MFNLISRSRSVRSVKKSNAAHGPDSPVVAEPHHEVPSLPTPKPVATESHLVAPVPTSARSDDDSRSFLFPPPSGPSHHAPPSPMTAERPNTSSGPGLDTPPTAHSFRSFDKRTSKDDLYLKSERPARAGHKSYHIPIREKPPSPTDSMRDPPSATMMSFRTQTPESFQDNNGIITIGMAIGSPTHPPAASFGGDWPPRTAIGLATTSPEVITPSEPTPPPSSTMPQRSKSGRWKIFGRSKSKRVKPEPASVLSSETDQSLPTNRTTTLDRSATERRAPRHTPLINRSHTAPLSLNPVGENGMRSNVSLSREGKLEITNPGSGMIGGSFLDVEIPDVKMERYSVMFQGLIQNNNSSSALLARRQATLDRLRTINARTEATAQAAERSYEHQRSPSLSSFPIPASQADTPPLTPRSRSATVPTGLPPHPKQSTTAPLNRTEKSQLPALVSKYTPKPSESSTAERTRTKEDNRLQGKNENHGFVFDQEQIKPVPAAPVMTAQTEDDQGEQLKPTVYEPKREMVKSAKTNQRSVKEQKASRAGNSEAVELLKETPSTSNTKRKDEGRLKGSVDETVLDTAVEISIARQISISRQQRDMLRNNIASRPSVRRIKVPPTPIHVQQQRQQQPPQEPRRALSPASANEGRLAATRMATPTLITPPESYSGSPLLQHRKSERIIVERT